MLWTRAILSRAAQRPPWPSTWTPHQVPRYRPKTCATRLRRVRGANSNVARAHYRAVNIIPRHWSLQVYYIIVVGAVVIARLSSSSGSSSPAHIRAIRFLTGSPRPLFPVAIFAPVQCLLYYQMNIDGRLSTEMLVFHAIFNHDDLTRYIFYFSLNI